MQNSSIGQGAVVWVQKSNFGSFWCVSRLLYQDWLPSVQFYLLRIIVKLAYITACQIKVHYTSVYLRKIPLSHTNPRILKLPLLRPPCAWHGSDLIRKKTLTHLVDLMQKLRLLISINLVSSTKEMNPITRKSMSRLVTQSILRALKHTRNGRHLKNPKIR